jgi:hypothetical protein
VQAKNIVTYLRCYCNRPVNSPLPSRRRWRNSAAAATVTGQSTLRLPPPRWRDTASHCDVTGDNAGNTRQQGTV